MFRASLRSAFLLVTLLVAAPSAEAADIGSVTFDVTIATVSKGSDTFAIEIRVTGSGLNNGTLTRPILGSTPISFKKDGNDLVINDDFNGLLALNAAYPDGNYALRVNGNNLQATLSYTRPLSAGRRRSWTTTARCCARAATAGPACRTPCRTTMRRSATMRCG